jgi:hypothetical protein
VAAVLTRVHDVVVVDLDLLVDEVPRRLPCRREALKRFPRERDVLLRHRPASIQEAAVAPNLTPAVEYFTRIPGCFRSTVTPRSSTAQLAN